MPTRRTLLLLLLAFLLRAAVQGWDSGLGSPHPDERQVAFVSEKVTSWLADPGFFAYGSLHFHVVRVAAAVLGYPRTYPGLLVGGRLLSLGASLGALALGWWLARRAWGARAADLALLLGAWVPLDLEQSHFATVEAHHSLWVMATLAACLWLAERPRTRSGAIAALIAGGALGASLAVKIASLPLALPLIVALVAASRRRGSWLAGIGSSAWAAAGAATAFWIGQPWAFAGAVPPFAIIGLAVVSAGASAIATRRIGWQRRALVGLAAVTLVACMGYGAVTMAPAVTGDPGFGRSWPAIGLPAQPLLNSAYLRGIGEQVAMVVGKADLPYARVYHGTLPFIYPAGQLVMWGFGPLLLGAIAWSAGCASWLQLRRWRRWLAGRWSTSSLLVVILLAWALPMACRLATLHVKYLRYWQPLVVPGVLLAAWGMLRLVPGWRRLLTTAVVFATGLWGVAYLWAFVEPHPHRTASAWLSPLIEAGQRVAFEHWDETIELKAPVERLSLPSYDLPDGPGKVRAWCTELANADWVVLTSNRVRRTVFANRERFPRTARLYSLLLSGQLGFEALGRADRGPRIFGLEMPVQEADESFVNYDFPRVVILRKVAPVDIEDIVSRVDRPLPYLEQLDCHAVERQYVETLPRIPAVPGAVSQGVHVGLWLAMFGALAVATWALLLPLVRGWPDAGLGVALVSGWILPPWLLWYLSELGLCRTQAATATAVVLALLGLGAWAGWRRRVLALRLWRQRRRTILLVVFTSLGVGLLFAIVRAGNPAVYWGEKPMDFAFLNAFLSSPRWPPGEPWMAGMPLYYYYFGEALAAFPMLVVGVPAGVGYNLMAATVPALVAALLLSLGAAFRRSTPRRLALVVPLLVLLTGNLAWPWLLDLAKAGRWFDLWWATSRVIPGFAIDEYPLWTTLFADLHGHFLALPVLVVGLMWGWATVNGPRRRWLGCAALCGICAAVLAATNPWDILVFTAALGFGALAAARCPALALRRLAVAAVISIVACVPFLRELATWLAAGTGGAGLFLTPADFAPAWAVLRHFGVLLIPLTMLAVIRTGRRLLYVLPLSIAGVFAGLSFGSSAAALALAVMVLLVAEAARSRDLLERLVWMQAGLAMGLVAACERFTLIDRMNTLFKVYNGAWLLLACALAFVIINTRVWQRKAVVAVWLPLELIGLVNLPLGIAQGWMQPRIRSPRPTLDGQAFLKSKDPTTWFLVRALQGMASPGDVVAEAAGPSYQKYTRIAMHTGLPVVVGWEWHLQQRGQSQAEIAARFADLELLYSGADPVGRRAVLDLYRVRWIVLGDVERSTYTLSSDDPFVGVPGVVRVVHHEGAALYQVRPAGSRTPSLPRRDDLPAELRPVAQVPIVAATALRSISADAEGIVAVLLDGTLLELESAGPGVMTEPPCELAAATSWRSRVWGLCADGAFVVADAGQWLARARLPGCRSLIAGNDLWAFGSGGLYHSADGRSWSQDAKGPVAAAAVVAATVVWSDGDRVWLALAGRRRLLAAPPSRIRGLAWQGPTLWALGADGLYTSGAGMLPWRRALTTVINATALCAHGDRLLIVLSDGVVVEHGRARCRVPWASRGGSELGSFQEPRGVAASADGYFVIADTQNHRLQWFSNEGACLDWAGGEGDGAGQFREPSGLALAPDGRLAVADTWNGRVQILGDDGRFAIVTNDLYGPRGVLWASDGSLFVADTGNRRLLRFAPPQWRGREIARLEAPVVGLAWSGDQIAAAMPAAGVIALIDPETGALGPQLAVPGWQEGTQQEGYLLALSSGELLASAPAPGELWLVDPASPTAPRLYKDQLVGATSMARLSNGQLVLALTFQNRVVRLPDPSAVQPE
jgi:YYY domain-containing protein